MGDKMFNGQQEIKTWIFYRDMFKERTLIDEIYE